MDIFKFSGQRAGVFLVSLISAFIVRRLSLHWRIQKVSWKGTLRKSLMSVWNVKRHDMVHTLDSSHISALIVSRLSPPSVLSRSVMEGHTLGTSLMSVWNVKRYDMVHTLDSSHISAFIVSRLSPPSVLQDLSWKGTPWGEASCLSKMWKHIMTLITNWMEALYLPSL